MLNRLGMTDVEKVRIGYAGSHLKIIERVMDKQQMQNDGTKINGDGALRVQNEEGDKTSPKLPPFF